MGGMGELVIETVMELEPAVEATQEIVLPSCSNRDML